MISLKRQRMSYKISKETTESLEKNTLEMSTDLDQLIVYKDLIESRSNPPRNRPQTLLVCLQFNQIVHSFALKQPI